MDKQIVRKLIDDDYQLLKLYERGDCLGANLRQFPPNKSSFITILNRFYSNLTLYAEDMNFSMAELSQIEDCKRSIIRESQIKDINELMRITMYDVEDVIRIIKSK